MIQEYEELINLIDELYSVFKYENGILFYDSKTQEKVNNLLEAIATKTKTFEKNKKNESKNIKKDLTVIDKNTNLEIQLVDIESMGERVKNITKNNNKYSCIKSLALTNKIAHSFDGDINSLQTKVYEYYNLLFPNEIKDKKEITFMQPIIDKLTKMSEINKYNLDTIKDKDFNDMLNNFKTDSKNIKKSTKIAILKQLNIPFNITDDEEINIKYEQLKNDNDEIIKAYIIKKYNEGCKIVELQSKVFAIKDCYISMIGQLLMENKFDNVHHELTKTEDASKGFEKMLIIDDRDLSYYVEVHMPNFLAQELKQEYKMIEIPERTVPKPYGSAVYYRDKKEVQNIRKEIKKGTLFENLIRALVISRGGEDEDPVAKNGDDSINLEITTPDEKNYQFYTKQIIEKPTIFESFSLDNNLNSETIKKYQSNYSNENVPIMESKKIANSKHEDLYNKFNYKNKINFINYSFNIINNGDLFDKILFNKLNQIDLEDNLDNIAKIFINLNIIKIDFEKKLEIIIEQLLNNKNYFTGNDKINLVTKIINNYIEERFKEYNININRNDSRRR